MIIIIAVLNFSGGGSVDRKHLMRFQSETSVFKFFRRSMWSGLKMYDARSVQRRARDVVSLANLNE